MDTKHTLRQPPFNPFGGTVSKSRKAMFEVETRKFMNNYGVEKGFMDILGSHHGSSHNKSMFAHIKYREAIHKTKPGTIERYTIACNYFAYIGYKVEWDGTLTVPKVFWYNTEGNGDLEAGMINDCLNRDYEANPGLTLDDPEYFEKLKALLHSKDASAIVIDSLPK